MIESSPITFKNAANIMVVISLFLFPKKIVCYVFSMTIELIESSYCSFWKCGNLTLDIGCPSPLPFNWKKVSSFLCDMCNVHNT
jgi:hypothetical protein